MINYDSILSAFDGKPTLLQWLKLVKKALDESVLKDITLNQDGANVVFTFNFEDGTSISTPAVTLPKGDTGAKGDKGDKGAQGPQGPQGPAGKLYIHRVSLKSGLFKDYEYYITVPSSDATPITKETANRLLYGFLEEIDDQGSYHASTVKNVAAYESSNELSIDGTLPPLAIAAAIESDTVSER